MLVIAQLLGGMAGAGLVQALTPRGGVADTATTLQPGVSIVQGLFIEAILTGILSESCTRNVALSFIADAGRVKSSACSCWRPRSMLRPSWHLS